MTRVLIAEFTGTFALVYVTLATALFAAPSAGLLPVALASGLTVLVMMQAVGGQSGGQFNPAVTLGLVAAGRLEAASAIPYIIAQLAGAAAAAALLQIVLTGAPAAGSRWNTFAAVANMYGDGRQFSLAAVFIAELVATLLLVLVYVGASSDRVAAGLAPIAVGCVVAACHLATIPISNTSINPARSTAAALFAGTTALSQLWLFWLAPILGGMLGGVLGRYLDEA